MKVVLTCFIAAFLLTATGLAQSFSASYGKQIGTMTVYVNITQSPGEGGISAKTDYKQRGKDVATDIVVWSTSNGIEYSINPSTIKFIGTDHDAYQRLSTAQIYNLIAYAAVEEGWSRGYNDCASSGMQTRVWDPSYTTRNFSIRCTNNGAMIKLVSVNSNQNPATVN